MVVRKKEFGWLNSWGTYLPRKSYIGVCHLLSVFKHACYIIVYVFDTANRGPEFRFKLRSPHLTVMGQTVSSRQLC